MCKNRLLEQIGSNEKPLYDLVKAGDLVNGRIVLHVESEAVATIKLPSNGYGGWIRRNEISECIEKGKET